MHCYYITVGPELPPEDRELWRYAEKIVNIWKKVGLELGLTRSKLLVIEANNHDRNENAALDMLMKWKDVTKNPSQRVLHQAIENCRAQQAISGMYLISCNYYTIYVAH